METLFLHTNQTIGNNREAAIQPNPNTLNPLVERSSRSQPTNK